MKRIPTNPSHLESRVNPRVSGTFRCDLGCPVHSWVRLVGQAARPVSPDPPRRRGGSGVGIAGRVDGVHDKRVLALLETDVVDLGSARLDRSPVEADDYGDELPLDQRVRTAAVPLLVIFGEEDQLYDDPTAAAEAYRDVPGARITILPGVGHSPNIEKPAETTRLVLDFAAGTSSRP